MLSSIEFIKQSLGLHLFFARIMKEHSFFLEVGFTSKDSGFIQQADAFRREFDGILGETISLSNSVVNPEILQSGEVFYFECRNGNHIFYRGTDTNSTDAGRSKTGRQRYNNSQSSA